MKKISFMLLICLGVLSPRLLAQEYNSLLYKIEHENMPPSYIFGTYHLAGSDFLINIPQVLEHYEAAGTIVVETIIDSSQLMTILPIMMMRDTGLSELLDSGDYHLLKQATRKTLNVDLSMFENMKPMVLSGMFISSIAEEVNPPEISLNGMPVDIWIYSSAQKQGRTVIPLESMQEQMKILFEGKPVEEQAENLMELVRVDSVSKSFSREMLAAYARGDLQKMWEVSIESEEMETELDPLLKNRNIKWISKLEKLLVQGNIFIAVGALHLPGEEGVLNLLKEQGFKVEAVKLR